MPDMKHIGAAAAAALALGAGGLGWFIRRPWPQTRGRLRVKGLHGPVEVIRDEQGVPHIYAQDEHDLFLAQGYVHAQDRLWQMDFQRRVGLGRLSEILGPSTLQFDRMFRTVGTNRSAERDLAALDGPTSQALAAYAEGVNALIAAQRRRLPLEYTLLRIKPEPWRPLDTLAWAKMLQWELSNDWYKILFRQKLIEKLGDERAAQLIPDYMDGAARDEHITAGFNSSFTAALDGLLATFAANPDALNPHFTEGLGSNAWVIAGSRSASGKPILANDTHLGLGVPGIWYEMGLHAPGYDCVGFSLPGATGIVIGHNQQIAWGVAVLRSRVQDIYVEKLNPANPAEYLVGDRYESFEVIREEIMVKGNADPEVLEVKVSRHGPLINDLDERSREFDQPLALKWTATQAPSTLLNAIRKINLAGSWAEFTAGLRDWDAPMQHFVYADVEGNIGSYCAGKVPVRACGAVLTPIPGWGDGHEWVETIPFDELPHSFNPPGGVIVAANNKPVSHTYPYFLAPEWCAFNRAQRIMDLLNEQPVLGLSDMARIQGDSRSLMAQKFTPFLVAAATADPLCQRVQGKLAAWDYHMEADSASAGVYEVALRAVVRALVEPALGTALTDLYLKREQQYTAFMEVLLDDPANPWWQAASANGLASREAVIAHGLAEAIRWWTDLAGPDCERWAWGITHRTTFNHPIYSQIPGLKYVGNAVVGATGGDAQSPFATGFFDSYAVLNGPVHRHLLDLADWNRSLAMITVGQSGHIFHPNYKDQLPLWQEIGFHAQYWDRAVLEARSRTRQLTLLP